MSARTGVEKGWEAGVAAARQVIEAGARKAIEEWLAPDSSAGLINSPRRRSPTPAQRAAAVLLARHIGELTAEAAVAAPFLFSREFRAAVKKDANSGWSLRQAKKSVAARTDPYLDVVRENVDVSTKELIRLMVDRGLIESIENGYRIKATGIKVRDSTMKSKISRLRKKLQHV